MRNYIILNGTNSNTITGLLIQSLAPISKPLMRTEIEEIDGRDGDIITPLGFSAYDKQITIGLYGTYDINAIIAFFNSEGTVTFSNEPDKYYNYQIYDQIDFERLVRFKTATVTLHCQPFKFATTGESQTLDSGDPVSDEGTNLVLEGSQLAPFSQFDLKGNTTQQTYTGKNLFNLNTSTKGSSGANNAVSFVVSNSDLTITQTGNGGNGYVWFEIPNSDSLLGKTVSISVGSMAHSGTTSTGRIIIYTNNLSEVANFSSITSSGWSASFSFPSSYPSGASSFRVYAYLNNMNTTTSVGSTTKFTNIQLELGSSTSSYEPYVGGVPAPNPDYPQAVKVVTGENVVKICGKNLNEWENVAWSSSTTTSSWCFQNGATGAYGANITSLTKYKITLPAGTYTAKVYDLSSNIINIQVCADGTPNEIAVTSPSNINSSNLSSTITLAEATTVVVRYRTTNPSLGIGNTKVQIEKGSATAYEPYQGQSYEVNLGKNLFDVNSITENTAATTNGVENHEVTYSSNNNCAVILIKTEPNSTYTLSFKSPINRIYFVGMKNTTLESGHSFSWAGNGAVMNTTSKDNYILGVIDVRGGGTISNISNGNVQLEKGSTATSYAAYFTPIELCKVDTNKDYIYKDGDDWYIHEEIGKLHLNGSEGWTAQSSYEGYFRGSVHLGAEPSGVSGFCDHFTVRTGGHGGYDYIWFQTGGDTKWIQISQSTIGGNTEALFKTWLAANPTSAYYKLATPTNTKITNTALIEQLDAIANQAHAYKTRTYVDSNAATGNVPHIIAATVVGSADGTVTNAGNIYSKPKLTIYGSGDVGVYLNGVQMLQIALGTLGNITIDTDLMEAYTGTIDNLQNRAVTGDYSNFKLAVGANKISFSGSVTSCIVENFSRWL